LLPVPPSLETRTKRGFPHFHSDDDGGLLTATTPNPTKIGGSYRFLHRTPFSDTGELAKRSDEPRAAAKHRVTTRTVSQSKIFVGCLASEFMTMKGPATTS